MAHLTVVFVVVVAQTVVLLVCLKGVVVGFFLMVRSLLPSRFGLELIG